MKKFITIILLFGGTSVLAHESKLECVAGDKIAILHGARVFRKNDRGEMIAPLYFSKGAIGTLLKKALIANIYKDGALQSKNVSLRAVRFGSSLVDNTNVVLTEEDMLICL